MKEVNLLNLPGKGSKIGGYRPAAAKKEKRGRPTINYKKQVENQSLRFLDGGM